MTPWREAPLTAAALGSSNSGGLTPRAGPGSPSRTPGRCSRRSSPRPASRPRRRDRRTADCTAGIRLLDVGCGSGLLLDLAQRGGAVVTGLDVAPGLLAAAHDRVPSAALWLADLGSRQHGFISREPLSGQAVSVSVARVAPGCQPVRRTG